MTPLERMAQYITVTESKCTAWTGAKDKDGYPMFWYNGRTGHATRILWELVYGSVPYNKLVCHKCDNPECLNLSHLFLGTHKQNTEDALAKGRMVGPRKITKSKAAAMNAMKQGGMTMKEIAEFFGVAESSVYGYVDQTHKRKGNYKRKSKGDE